MFALNGDSKGIALICNKQGIIEEIINDELGLTKEIAPGTSFYTIVDEGSKDKATLFFEDAKREGATFDWDLNLCSRSNIIRLYFSGGVINEEKYLVLGIISRDRLDKFYEELMRINNEQSTALRAALKHASHRNKQDGKIKDYDAFTSLNNELITVQRELSKKNFELHQVYSKLNEDLKKARHLHLRTFPDYLPQLDSYSLGAYYEPTMSLGGDFYDFVLEGDKLLFYLTDVTGHGIDGAMVTVFIKEAIHSYLNLTKGNPEFFTPKNIFRHLMTRFRQEGFPDDYFICIFIGVLDLEKNQMSYLAMGMQNHPLMLKGYNQLHYLPLGDLPISNAIPEFLYELTEFCIDIGKDNFIIFTTDGIREQEAKGQIYDERFEQVLQRAFGLEPEDIVNFIVADLNNFCKREQQDDDIAFLIIKRNK